MFLLQFSKRFSTSSAILIRFICVLPQVGHETNCIPCFLKPSAISISLATFISSIGSLVSDTLIVSPIPSANKVPIPNVDLIVPLKTVPDSVTPK